ncbi:MAG TPA: alpha/beta hydrolase [Solirubrobacteraceae bacterium]|nr:alpha/beta hydrolase [Solirubrobacteraceae bacterium]
MPTVELDAGTIHYENAGPADGRPVVFVHGYAMGASLWRPLSERLAGRGLRCIAPTWPLGAHTEPMRHDADLTMGGVAGIIASFLDALELDDVVLVGNDTGGAIAQIVAGTYPQRLGALVLTSCDAFEHFPPPILKPLIAASRTSALFRLALRPIGTRTGRRFAYGKLAHADLDALSAEWARPALRDRDVAEDLRRFTASMVRSVTVDAAERLPTFVKPALVAWSADDAFFDVADGRRLAELLPHGRFALIERARTFSMIDRTDELAQLVGEFAVAGGATPAGSASPSAAA